MYCIEHPCRVETVVDFIHSVAMRYLFSKDSQDFKAFYSFLSSIALNGEFVTQNEEVPSFHCNQ